MRLLITAQSITYYRINFNPLVETKPYSVDRPPYNIVYSLALRSFFCTLKLDGKLNVYSFGIIRKNSTGGKL